MKKQTAPMTQKARRYPRILRDGTIEWKMSDVGAWVPVDLCAKFERELGRANKQLDKLYAVIDAIAAGDIDGDSMIDLARGVFKNRVWREKK